MSAGMIDPTKVVRTALQDAASVAGLVVKTNAMIAEKPGKKPQVGDRPEGTAMGQPRFRHWIARN